jgi:hypothetical protein
MSQRRGMGVRNHAHCPRYFFLVQFRRPNPATFRCRFIATRRAPVGWRYRISPLARQRRHRPGFCWTNPRPICLIRGGRRTLRSCLHPACGAGAPRGTPSARNSPRAGTLLVGTDFLARLSVLGARSVLLSTWERRPRLDFVGQRPPVAPPSARYLLDRTCT